MRVKHHTVFLFDEGDRLITLCATLELTAEERRLYILWVMGE